MVLMRRNTMTRMDEKDEEEQEERNFWNCSNLRGRVWFWF